MEGNESPNDGGPPGKLVDFSPDKPMDTSESTGNANADPSSTTWEQQVTDFLNIPNSDFSQQANSDSAVVNKSSVNTHHNPEHCNIRSNNSNYSTTGIDKNTKTPDNGDNKNVSDDNTKRKERFDEFSKNKYRITDPAPYYVYVEHAEKNVGRLFPIRVGHFLYQCEELRKGIVDIIPIGINRVKVITKTYSMANKLVDHPLLLENKLRSYIPTYFTQKKGVVKLVDTIFDIDYLWKNIHSDQEVVDIKRLRKKVVNRDSGKEELIDRQTIVVTFLGSVVPNRIRINLCTFPVEPWVYPVVKCYSCLRFGHVASQCRGKLRCSRCGSDGHGFENCPSETSECIHCSSKNHHANSRKCPAYVRQHNIKKIMASENVSFKEAEHIVDNPSYAKVTTHNRFSVLGNEENFPSLPKQDYNPTTSSFFLRKPRNGSVRSSPQQVSQEKRKASATSPISPTSETQNHERRHSFTKRPRPSFAPQYTTQQSSKQFFEPQQSARRQTQTLPDFPPALHNDYIDFKKNLLASINTHFDGLIKKILPAAMYSNAETRTIINHFYSSLQSLLNDNSVSHNATT